MDSEKLSTAPLSATTPPGEGSLPRSLNGRRKKQVCPSTRGSVLPGLRVLADASLSGSGRGPSPEPEPLKAGSQPHDPRGRNKLSNPTRILCPAVLAVRICHRVFDSRAPARPLWRSLARPLRGRLRGLFEGPLERLPDGPLRVLFQSDRAAPEPHVFRAAGSLVDRALRKAPAARIGPREPRSTRRFEGPSRVAVSKDRLKGPFREALREACEQGLLKGPSKGAVLRDLLEAPSRGTV
mmetsp:Transcript_31720/g.111716  ORF Transcript_31720/g.111716 Transcript_31720/m.111716 type:complete len:239 (-) Transcript_31720:219-935(-)